METTEKIVEAYVRYVKRWATIPNIKCDGQFEIDLLAIDPVGLERYHIESGVSVSGSFSALTDKPYDPGDLKIRVKIGGARRTLGYFIERKFGSPGVIARLRDYGFKRGNYSKVVVTWAGQKRLLGKRTKNTSSFGTSATSSTRLLRHPGISAVTSLTIQSGRFNCTCAP